MKKRPTAKSRPKKANDKDPYLSALYKNWPCILTAYDDFKDEKPILEYRIPEELVYVYPAMDYINDLTERTREQARQSYLDATAAGEFLIFVRDSTERVLRSYQFPIEEPTEDCSESRIV